MTGTGVGEPGCRAEAGQPGQIVGAALLCGGERLGRLPAAAVAHDRGEQLLETGRCGLVSPGEEVTVGSAMDLFDAGQGRFAVG